MTIAEGFTPDENNANRWTRSRDGVQVALLRNVKRSPADWSVVVQMNLGRWSVVEWRPSLAELLAMIPNIEAAMRGAVQAFAALEAGRIDTKPVGAAERGEAFARTGDVAVLVAGIEPKTGLVTSGADIAGDTDSPPLVVPRVPRRFALGGEPKCQQRDTLDLPCELVLHHEGACDSIPF